MTSCEQLSQVYRQGWRGAEEQFRDEIDRLRVELAAVLLGPRYKAGWEAGHSAAMEELRDIRRKQITEIKRLQKELEDLRNLWRDLGESV